MALTAEGGQRKWEKNFPVWVEKCTTKHAGFYSYPSSCRERGTNGNWIIRIVCPVHGDFWQAPEKHSFGRGCSKCSGIGTNKVSELKTLFPEFLWPSGLDVRLTKEEFTLECQEHGEFTTTVNRLQTAYNRGVKTPCPKCNKTRGGVSRRKANQKWVEEVAGRYESITLDPTSITVANAKARFVCSEHGEFWSLLQDVRAGHGCSKCGRLLANKKTALDPRIFLSNARDIHGDTYEYDLNSLVTSKTPMRIICKKHGEFMQIPGNHTSNGAGCPACSNSTSSGELQIKEWVESLGMVVVPRDRKQLGGKEIDIFIPELKVGIEYCGLYWHGEQRLPGKYHKNKSDLAKSVGIKLITVFEDEWLNPSTRDKVMHRIASSVIPSKRIMARETECQQISWKEARGFLDKHHLQGAGMPARVCLGLFHRGALVSVSTWGGSRFNNNYEWELLRFSGIGSDRVVGAIGKMLSRFKKDFDPRSIITYSDSRWGWGEAYRKVGFISYGDTNPGYFWCKNSERYSRYDFQKHKLVNFLRDFDPDLSEVENCHLNGYWRIFDCGHTRWVWNKDGCYE